MMPESSKPRCEPPEPTDHRLHWLRRGDEFDVFAWDHESDRWSYIGSCSPEYMHGSGWRYHAPAVPPGIGKALERELKALAERWREGIRHDPQSSAEHGDYWLGVEAGLAKAAAELAAVLDRVEKGDA